MKIFDVASLVADMPERRVSPGISQEDALGCMRVLTTFNGCLVGLVHFSGQTAWERHAGGDEILVILEGETELTQLTPEGATKQVARKGDTVQIPAGVWHSQCTRSPVKLMFFTVGEGSESSVTTPTF